MFFFRWRDQCPTFNWIIDKIKDYFDMDVKVGKDLYTYLIVPIIFMRISVGY